MADTSRNQCRSWRGHNKTIDGRERCVLMIMHDGEHQFELLPLDDPKYRRKVTDSRCRTFKREFIIGMELVWQCIHDGSVVHDHEYRVAPDEENV